MIVKNLCCHMATHGVNGLILTQAIQATHNKTKII